MGSIGMKTVYQQEVLKAICYCKFIFNSLGDALEIESDPSCSFKRNEIYLIVKRYKEVDSEVALAEWSLTWLNKGRYWSGHFDLLVVLILARDVVKEDRKSVV